MRPSKIYFSGDAGNVVTGLSWYRWTPTGASGFGSSDINAVLLPRCLAVGRGAITTFIPNGPWCFPSVTA
jgi:hypothetical protein